MSTPHPPLYGAHHNHPPIEIPSLSLQMFDLRLEVVEFSFDMVLGPFYVKKLVLQLLMAVLIHVMSPLQHLIVGLHTKVHPVKVKQLMYMLLIMCI